MYIDWIVVATPHLFSSDALTKFLRTSLIQDLLKSEKPHNLCDLLHSKTEKQLLYIINFFK